MTTPADVYQSIESARMGEGLIRLSKLKAYRDAMGWNDSELARQLSRSPSQIHSWMSGERMIGERLARAIETELGKPRFWLDERQEENFTHPRKLVARAPSAKYSPVDLSANDTNEPRSIPVLPWPIPLSMLNENNEVLEGVVDHLDTFAKPSTRAKFVQMPDASMAPEFNPGDHLLLDPTIQPEAGDIVLVQLPSGEQLVRKFIPRTAKTFDVEALNPNYAKLSSVTDEVKVLATMLEHRRYRARRS